MRSSLGKGLLPDQCGKFGKGRVRSNFDRRLFFAIAPPSISSVVRFAPDPHGILPCLDNIDFSPTKVCEDTLQVIIAASKQGNQLWPQKLGALTAGGSFFKFFFEAFQDVQANGSLPRQAKSSGCKKRRG